MANNTILLMDDDENICKVIRLYLEKEGMNVQVAHDGAAGLELFHKETPNLVLLDIMMPGMDGIEVIKQIRKESSTPVIMLTAKGDTIDNTVEYCGKKLELPPKELELLYFLASHPNKVFTREQLLQKVWEFDFYGDSRTIDVHIKRLREKLGDEQPWHIKTVWGVGYKFEVDEAEVK